MEAALYQAFLGKGKCAPNPSVGAIAVRHGEIIARGFHEGPGMAHAEEVVLRQLGHDTSDITLYVTLEPCNHWGRTPPCTDAILKAGVKSVVYGFRDPNPLVAQNDTPGILNRQGVQVIFYPLEEITQFYQSYAFWSRTGRPFVTLKMAQSLDGKIAGKNGERLQISNERCREYTLERRFYTDVILTTARTIQNDSPQFDAIFQGEKRIKPLAILDKYCAMQPTFFKEERIYHIFHGKEYTPSFISENVHYHPVSLNEKRGLNLKEVLSDLGKLGFHDVWAEVGGKVFSALHEQELVQETFLYIAPMVLGSDATNAFFDLSFSTAKASSWKILDDNAVLHLEWEER